VLFFVDRGQSFSQVFKQNFFTVNTADFCFGTGGTDFINLFNKPEIYNLPTSGVAAISFKTDKWEEIANSNFKVEFVVTPKIL